MSIRRQKLKQLRAIMIALQKRGRVKGIKAKRKSKNFFDKNFGLKRVDRRMSRLNKRMKNWKSTNDFYDNRELADSIKKDLKRVNRNRNIVKGSVGAGALGVGGYKINKRRNN